MIRRRPLPVIVGLLVFASALGSARRCLADSAEVLPKGVARVSGSVNLWLPIEKRFNSEGETEDLAADFNTRLDSTVFADLRALESFFGLPTGSASLGDSVVSFEYQFTDLELRVQYGVTDRLTVGVFVPYWWQKNKIRARLDPTLATVGKSPALGSLVPLGATPDAVPLTTEDVQQILGPGLDINGDGSVDVPGFGFKRFQTWSDSGFADVEAGFRYQYLRTPDWRLAFTGGARFPTGQVDDPDDLSDISFGSGAYALLFRFHQDYTAIPNLVLNGTFRYDLVLPDSEVRRVPDSVDQPITRNKEKVDRDLGDIFEFEVSATYNVLQPLSVSGLYRFGFKLKDQVSGTRGFAYESLEEETNYTEHIAIFGVAYSTLPLYLEKKFRIPLTASLSYRTRFAGTNNVSKSSYLTFALEVLF